MKIAIILLEFPKISETFILNQITGLLDAGHDVQIFANKFSNDKKIHEAIKQYNLLERTQYFNMPDNEALRILKAAALIPFYFLKNPIVTVKSLNIFKYGKEAASLKLFYFSTSFISKNFDIMHYHYGLNGLVGVALKEIINKDAGILVSFHGCDASQYVTKKGRGCYKKLFKSDALISVVSNDMKNKLINLGCAANRIIIHHSGTNTDFFHCDRETSIKKEKTHFLTIARLTEKKGLEYSIRAFKKLLSQYDEKNLSYTIIGGGPLFIPLKKLITELGLKDKVVLIGFKNHEEIFNYFKISDIFLLTSITSSLGDEEGIPGSIREAMSMQLPVIATHHGGIPELVIDKQSGFLVPEKDIAALTQKMKILIDDPKLRHEMGNAGREIIKNKFNIDKLNRQLEEIYYNQSMYQ